MRYLRYVVNFTMIELLRTNSEHPDFQRLVNQLDAYLAATDGVDHAFYAQYNKIVKIKHVVLAYSNEELAGCGAIREFEPGVMEVKRMFTMPAHRSKGIATLILRELESWSKELGAERCILETGKRMPAAVNLYKKNGYEVIPNYGQYAGVENSCCFEKKLGVTT